MRASLYVQLSPLPWRRMRPSTALRSSLIPYHSPRLLSMSDDPQQTCDEYELGALSPLRRSTEARAPDDGTQLNGSAQGIVGPSLAAESIIPVGRISSASIVPTASAESKCPSVAQITSAKYSALCHVSHRPMDLRDEDTATRKLLSMYSQLNALGYEGERRGSRELLDLATAFLPRFEALLSESSPTQASLESLDKELRFLFAEHAISFSVRLVSRADRPGCHGEYRRDGTALRITASAEAEAWLREDSNRRVYCAVEGGSVGPQSAQRLRAYPIVYVWASG